MTLVLRVARHSTVQMGFRAIGRMRDRLRYSYVLCSTVSNCYYIPHAKSEVWDGDAQRHALHYIYTARASGLRRRLSLYMISARESATKSRMAWALM
jgi:hypothetical protein